MHYIHKCEIKELLSVIRIFTDIFHEYCPSGHFVSIEYYLNIYIFGVHSVNDQILLKVIPGIFLGKDYAIWDDIVC